MDVRALASAGFSLVQRYGVDFSKALMVLALMFVPGACQLLLDGRAYASGVVTGGYALLFGAILWTGVIGTKARRAAALDPAGAPAPPAQEWWRPLPVQRHGEEIAKALAGLALLGCPGTVCLGPRLSVAGIVWLVLWGGYFWTSAVGSEARRLAVQREAAERAAAARVAMTQEPGAPWPPAPTFGATSPAPAPASTREDDDVAKLLKVGTRLGLAAALVGVVLSLLACAFLAWLCLIMLYGLGHRQPPPWLLP